MKSSGEFVVPRAASDVFGYIADPAQFSRCFPDYEAVQIDDETHFTVSLAVAFGAHNGRLDLHLERMAAEPPEALRYTGWGLAARNDIRFELTFQLAPELDATRVAWSGEFAVEGMLALFAGPMVEQLGERNLRQLATNLQSALDNSSAPTHSQL